MGFCGTRAPECALRDQTFPPDGAPASRGTLDGSPGLGDALDRVGWLARTRLPGFDSCLRKYRKHIESGGNLRALCSNLAERPGIKAIRANPSAIHTPQNWLEDGYTKIPYRQICVSPSLT